MSSNVIDFSTLPRVGQSVQNESGELPDESGSQARALDTQSVSSSSAAMPLAPSPLANPIFAATEDEIYDDPTMYEIDEFPPVRRRVLAFMPALAGHMP
mmetsp:Transcript_12945/g.21014  ORF Transcript_12945/g.21014 Transcript_12945/m.21014 type:complete len:99 (+) Transcript_12945:67-363(+)|eukprot:CAMPEP_0169211574 /NCGR_PEP_ID=MMETSP1016-20121227/15824_1 /TAXON_ID=342587 /ORGANISM="Karlodinium micrum, Strain CCMP2283" /LENGTH=98 /DNA_ID=CAMNT_0009289197 /DNA_START=57 /DNA_END=353 /DNA_ORIENTATION=+